MKKERKILIFQFLIHGSLLLSIAWSAFLAFSSFLHTGYEGYSSNQFFFALLNIILLILVYVAVTLFVNNYYLRLVSESKHVDELTGFMTRHAFEQVFEHVILDTRRSLEPLSLLLVDIDHFRLVNEEYGRRVGDQLLTMLSSAIRSVLKVSDITCRWGGDQMLVVLKGCTEKEGCLLAEKMLVKIRQQKLVSKDESISITTSIGVSQMLASDDEETLVTRSETGLYSARDNGRDTYAIGYDWILIDYSCNPIV